MKQDVCEHVDLVSQVGHCRLSLRSGCWGVALTTPHPTLNKPSHLLRVKLLTPHLQVGKLLMKVTKLHVS